MSSASELPPNSLFIFIDNVWFDFTRIYHPFLNLKKYHLHDASEEFNNGKHAGVDLDQYRIVDQEILNTLNQIVPKTIKRKYKYHD